MRDFLRPVVRKTCTPLQWMLATSHPLAILGRQSMRYEPAELQCGCGGLPAAAPPRRHRNRNRQARRRCVRLYAPGGTPIASWRTTARKGRDEVERRTLSVESGKYSAIPPADQSRFGYGPCASNLWVTVLEEHGRRGLDVPPWQPSESRPPHGFPVAPRNCRDWAKTTVDKMAHGSMQRFHFSVPGNDARELARVRQPQLAANAFLRSIVGARAGTESIEVRWPRISSKPLAGRRLAASSFR